MKTFINLIKEKAVSAYLILLSFWLSVSLLFIFFITYLNVTNQQDKIENIINQIEWRIDGTFKNNPNNIWH